MAWLIGLCGCAASPVAGTAAEGSRRPAPSTMALLRGATSAHEHARSAADVERLLATARRLGIERVVIVGSDRRTLEGQGELYGGLDHNNALLVAAAGQDPRVIPFAAVDPTRPAALARLEHWIDRGARGLKLYSGHALFYREPLDAPRAMALYRLAEDRGLPLVFHVNTARYGAEFERVLQQHRDLRVNCPHFCLQLTRPDRLRRWLERYPNLWLDVSFGFYVHQGFRLVSEDRGALRRLILRHADRFLWSADLVVDETLDQAGIVAAWRAYLAMLAAREFEHEGRRYHGLDLPPAVVRQILVDNPRAWLGDAAKTKQNQPAGR